MSGPLAGFRIIEMSRAMPGQVAGGWLADFGADVISIIEPGLAERQLQSGEYPPDVAAVCPRNTRSIAVSLRHDEGRKIVLELAKTADGFLESNRPGVVKKLGVDYDAVRAVNPSVVYCSLSGFGQYGPYADVGTHDLSYQGIAGLLPLDVNGRPYPPAINHSDINAIWAGAMAMLLGLIERTKSSLGQYIDVAFCDTSVRIPPGGTTAVQGIFASYNIYETKDGEYLTISTMEHAYWERLCNFVGRPEWKSHIRPEPGALREEQIRFLRAFFNEKNLAEWIEIMQGKQLQYGPVNRTTEQLRDDPQLRAREMVLENVSPLSGDKGYEPGFPYKMSRTPLTLRRGPTFKGSDTEAILRELNYSKEQMTALREANTIG